MGAGVKIRGADIDGNEPGGMVLAPVMRNLPRTDRAGAIIQDTQREFGK